MPLISQVGRKDLKTRGLIAGLYAVLILGGLSMVVPFVLLLSGSTKSGVDMKDIAWVPRFLVDDTVLYQKHIESLFNEQLEIMRAVYDSDDTSFEKVLPPTEIRTGLVSNWVEFATGDVPVLSYTIGYMQAQVSRTFPMFLRSFKQTIIDRYRGSIDAANQSLETEFIDWNAFFLVPEDAYQRRNNPLITPLGDAWRDYRKNVAPEFRYYFSLEGFFKSLYLKTQFTRNIAEFNQAHGTTYESYDEIRLSSTLPEGTEAERQRWESFVRNSLNLAWVRVDEEASGVYRDYLRVKYGDLDHLNRKYGTIWAAWADIPLITDVPWSGLARSDWEAFITGWQDPDTGIVYQPAADQLRIDSVDEQFRTFLLNRHGDLASLNRNLGLAFSDWSEITPPQKEAHYLGLLEHRSRIRSEFVTRNFRSALDHIAFHGRGIRNTIIYCGLAILSALLINPLAAYALSRYKPPSAYKLMLFMLLTMAFPPMVTQIPVFLMMRDLNLLNTFAALLLPGLAHGYSIFLLKGFFDALPRELYESASMDGAGEWTMFWNITMSLSKPILAVVALQAFTAAYSNFMFALLICQDEAMWTMMVWLYQLQMRSGPGVVYASLIIAAIPTLIIFIFCQNIILRGIVVPVEK
jgi:multiple sugar transport system permease protein